MCGSVCSSEYGYFSYRHAKPQDTSSFESRPLYIFTKRKTKSLHMRGDHVMTVSFCLQRSRSGKSQETNVGTQM